MLASRAAALTDLGRYTEAEAIYRRILEPQRRELGPDSLALATSLHDLGRCREGLRDEDGACTQWSASIEILARIPNQAATCAGLACRVARMRFAQGRADEAERVLHLALKAGHASRKERHVRDALELLVKHLRESERGEEADALQDEFDARE